jgi:hypothetical protein
MPPILRHRNRQLSADLTPLVEAGLEVTYLTADSAASSGTITVKDIDGFAANQFLLIGELGQEGSEIVRTHTATAPSGTTITLNANTAFAHGAGTPIYRIEFNQIEWAHAATIGGSKSTLATSNIQADQLVQIYTDTSQTTGYYFARFKNSIDSTTGSYSDGVPYGGFAANTLAFIISWALKRNGLNNYEGNITKEFCIEETNDCLNEIQGSQLRWAEHQNLNAVIGDITAGTPVVTLPTDIYDSNSNKSLINVRLSVDKDLRYLDPIEMEAAKIGAITTTLVTQVTAGATSMTLTDADDFEDSGSISFFVSGTEYSATYTAIDRSTGVISGIPASGTGSITVTVAAATYIHQGVSFGTPLYYTVNNGNIDLYPVPDGEYHGRNLYGDYWNVVTAVDSEGDTIDVQRFDMVKYWLAWKMRCQLKNEGALDLNDGFYSKFKERLNQAIRNAPRHIKYKRQYTPNRIRYR